MNTALSNFCKFYSNLAIDNLTDLSAIYDKQAVFEDPIHKVSGLDNISIYFQKMLANTAYCRFQINSHIEQDGQAYIRWLMSFSHPRLNKGKEINVPGVSYIEFDHRVTYHRDYMDMGNMVYEHVAILGAVIRKVKSEMLK